MNSIQNGDVQAVSARFAAQQQRDDSLQQEPKFGEQNEISLLLGAVRDQISELAARCSTLEQRLDAVLDKTDTKSAVSAVEPPAMATSMGRELQGIGISAQALIDRLDNLISRIKL